MSVREMKSIYHSLKSSGDLLKMYPYMTGEWEKDSKEFKLEYSATENIMGNLDIELEEDLDFEEDLGFDEYY